MDEELRKRVNRAVSSLAGNESLFSELGTETAKTVLDWGIAATRHVVSETGGLDDAAAEAAAYPRLRAVRQLIRLLNQAAAGWPAPDRVALLDQIFTQAATLHGAAFQPPAPERRLPLESADFGSAGEWIAQLIAILPGPSALEPQE